MSNPDHSQRSQITASPLSSNASGASTVNNTPRRGLSEDVVAGILGVLLIGAGLFGSWWNSPYRAESAVVGAASSVDAGRTETKSKAKAWDSPLKPWVGKLRDWWANPLDAWRKRPPQKPGATEQPSGGTWEWWGFLGAAGVVGVIGSLGQLLQRRPIGSFIVAFPALFLLATLAFLMAGQTAIKNAGLEYVLWALLVGLLISNGPGVPRWLRPAISGEFYIKVGLVLLGAGVLFSELLALGIPGIFISWVVTPIVLILTYWFGQRFLRIESRSLNMVISADMSVCGVSAAIATAAACRAKKEELSVAIGLSLTFTVLMMFTMPYVILQMGLDPRVGGAWIGGTIDATGAVAAAGLVLGEVGGKTAVTVKMIQNILIGAIAFAVAVYWARWIEPLEDAERQARAETKSETPTSPAVHRSPRVGLGEIWLRFPKFVLGFLLASLACSFIAGALPWGRAWVESANVGFHDPLRGWLFCLAFVCIGLETNFRELAPFLKSGKPLALYVCGQLLNLLLTLAMAYLMFGILFPVPPS